MTLNFQLFTAALVDHAHRNRLEVNYRVLSNRLQVSTQILAELAAGVSDIRTH